MVPSTASLETLPLLVLERICEYLDDDSEKRRSLRAFSLTSRCCCTAAAAQRFCQIQLKLLAPEEPEIALRRWTDALNPDGRHRHVRRLKVTWAMTEEERRKKDLLRKNEEIDEDEDDEDWNICRSFDMNNFCRPSKDCIQEGSEGGTIAHHPDEAWVPLSRFISQLPGLQDLVWEYGSRMPRSVLSAVSVRGCRLHMHHFRLGSLVQLRDSPQPIHPDDYALATSPSLSSIVVKVCGITTDGNLDYTEEAVMRMVAGTAPNLAHVCLIQTRAGSSLALIEAVRLGKPAWSGFFSPGTAEAEADQLPVLGSLKSLVFTSFVSHGINHWARLTEFNNLRCLIMPWRLESGVALAEMATRGDFKALDTLGLLAIEDETDQGQEALNRLLESLDPLQRLELDGYISNEAFDIVLRRHGGALRNLSMDPYRDCESLNPLVEFSEAVVQRLAEQCPNLEQVRLQVNRTRGDNRETGIYRALSRLPRLRRAFLRLLYSVGPDEEYWDEEVDGEYPLSSSIHGEEIPFVYLREVFSNSAIDATLALSIFNLISSGGSLRYLRLEPRRKIGFNSPASLGIGQFQDLLRWFNRSWVCKRDIRDRVTVGELDKKRTVSASKEWQFELSDEEKWYGDEIFGEVFRDIWPQKTAEWWNDWESLPLSDGAA
jgi:hypothetical protein